MGFRACNATIHPKIAFRTEAHIERVECRRESPAIGPLGVGDAARWAARRITMGYWHARALWRNQMGGDCRADGAAAVSANPHQLGQSALRGHHRRLASIYGLSVVYDCLLARSIRRRLAGRIRDGHAPSLVVATANEHRGAPRASGSAPIRARLSEHGP